MSEPPRILVVDDDPVVREVLQVSLEEQGLVVLDAPDAQQALQRVRRDRPDLVLLDLNLPDRDGLAVLQDVRLESSVPVIVVTARADAVDEIRGLELGADGYVSKPFSLPEIAARIRAVLRRSRGPRPL
jgi:DNA-binding response OmpR family regulator